MYENNSNALSFPFYSSFKHRISPAYIASVYSTDEH